jgi:hypothetical protein
MVGRIPAPARDARPRGGDGGMRRRRGGSDIVGEVPRKRPGGPLPLRE